MKYKAFQKFSSLTIGLSFMMATAGFINAERTDKTIKTDSSTRAAVDSKTGDIVAAAEASGKFTTLCAALKAAGLIETLQGAGPFTVFAPTDEAFAKLPKATLDDLLKPENKKKLAGILTYHVLPGKIVAADVKTMSAKTVNGQSLNVVAENGKVTVNEAKVVTVDVAASNGVIHAIDTVLMPK